MPSAVSITRTARRTLDVLLLLLIGLVVVMMVIARGIPAVTGGATFVVGGGSMEPAIPIGSAVVALPVAASDIAVGDIVSLQVGEHAVFTHRIVRLAERDGAVWLATQGDANTAPDPSLVPATAVIGRVGISIPLAGFLIKGVGSPQGLLFLVSLGVLVLAGAWMLEALEDDLAESARLRERDGFGPLLPDPGTTQGAPG